MADLPNAKSRQEAVPAPRSRKWMRAVGVILLILAGILGWYLAVFLLGWQSGQTALDEKRETELLEQLSRQVSLAQEDIRQGNYMLAMRRLEWVLDREPDNSQAQTLYQQAQTALDKLVTPQIVITPFNTPTAAASPTPTSPPIEDPTAELQRLRELVAAELWEEALRGLIAFQWQFPGHERQETDEMLYEAYIGLGLQLVQGEQVELGLAYIEQAEKLGDLPESVSDYRTWAELYLQGIAFYDVNWAAAIYYFRDLCLAAPFYQSSCDLLHQALEAYGDQLAVALDWCPAQSLFEEASQHGRSQALVEKLSQAREACLLATPTPIPSADSTAPITVTQPITAPFFVPAPFPTSSSR